MEVYELIRVDDFHRAKSIRAIARERRVGRPTVRAALASALPPPRKTPVRNRKVFTDAHRRLVDEWLETDLEAPRKQRHTTTRIFHRLVSETAAWAGDAPGRIPFQGAESTVREYVSRRRAEIGLAAREAFVLLAHPLVPVPEVRDFEDLNRRLLECCAKDEGRRVADRPVTIGEARQAELGELLLLPDEGFNTVTIESAKVDSLARICVETNRYSVPARLAHREVELRLGALTIEVWHGGRCVATLPRLAGR